METQQHEADTSSARSGERPASFPVAVAAPEPARALDGGQVATSSHPYHPTARQLEAVFASMADGVIFTAPDVGILAMNAAARRILALDARPDFAALTPAARWRLLRVRDGQGFPIPKERLRAWREGLLAGHTLGRADFGALIVRALDGRDVALGVSAAPVRGAGGAISGTVWVVRDVTESRQERQRTRDALAALVAMAELIVAGGPSPAADAAPVAARPHDRTSPQARPARLAVAAAGEATSEAATLPRSSPVAHQLSQLALTVMGCRQLDIVAEDPRRGGLRLVASAGLTVREERHWRAEAPWRGRRLSDLLPAALVARLEGGESVPIDLTQPEFASMPNPFRARSLLLSPMRLGGRLVGVIALHYGPVAHTFTEDEIAMAAGAARLVALVLERERLQREREEARASALALREANRRMDDFLAVAAHELRSPVQAGLMGIELARRRSEALRDRAHGRARDGEGEWSREREELGHLGELLAEAQSSVENLARLVADLLDVSRAQAGQLDIHPQAADLATVVREAIARQRATGAERIIHLRLPRSLPVPVFADADRIGEVVTNLLGNAAKYTPEDLPVEVRVQVGRGRARVSVRDEGPGLPIEEQGRVWDRYHQAQGIRANAGTGVGLGLGLYIVREIVQAHGGQVGVRSSPGEGSMFWFTLPLDTAAKSAPPPPAGAA